MALEGERHSVKTEGTPLTSLPVTTITMHTVPPTFARGKLVATNDRYRCYAVKEKLVRIVTPAGAKGLFRGHTTPLVDIKFLAPDSDTVASVGQDGSVFVWQVVPSGPDTLEAHLLAEIRGAGGFSHVLWHPVTPSVVAVLGPAGVTVIDLAKLPSGTLPTAVFTRDAGDLPPAVVIDTAAVMCVHYAPSSSPVDVNDVVFSTEGDHLLAACGDGNLVAWRLGEEAVRGGLHRPLLPQFVFKPRGHTPVDSVRLLPRDADEPFVVLVGTSNNSVLQMFRLSPALRDPELVQTLSVNPEAVCRYVLEVSPAGDLLFIANTETPDLLVVQVSAAALRFTHWLHFSLKFTVLSLLVQVSAGDGDSFTDDTSSTAVDVFAVQTGAVQQYYLDPQQWLPAIPAPAAPTASVPPPMAPPIAVASQPVTSPQGGGLLTPGALAPPPPPAEPVPEVVPEAALEDGLDIVEEALAGLEPPPPPAGMPQSLMGLLQGSMPASGPPMPTVPVGEPEHFVEEEGEEENMFDDGEEAPLPPAPITATHTVPVNAGVTPVEGSPSFLAPAPVVAALPPHALAALDASMQETFRSCFTEALVPALERAAQSMFSQLGGHVQRGMDTLRQDFLALQRSTTESQAALTAATAELSAAAAKLNSAVSGVAAVEPVMERASQAHVASTKELKNLVTSVRAELRGIRGIREELQAAVASLPDLVASTLASAAVPVAAPAPAPAPAPVPAPTPAPVPAPAPTPAPPKPVTGAGSLPAGPANEQSIARVPAPKSGDLSALASKIRIGEFDMAFSAALNASNVELVVWLVSLSSTSSSASAVVPTLSHLVRVCLFQQLANDLVSTTSLKLVWLAALAPALSPTDDIVRAHAPGIVALIRTTLPTPRTAFDARNSQALTAAVDALDAKLMGGM